MLFVRTEMIKRISAFATLKKDFPVQNMNKAISIAWIEGGEGEELCVCDIRA